MRLLMAVRHPSLPDSSAFTVLTPRPCSNRDPCIMPVHYFVQQHTMFWTYRTHWLRAAFPCTQTALSQFLLLALMHYIPSTPYGRKCVYVQNVNEYIHTHEHIHLHICTRIRTVMQSLVSCYVLRLYTFSIHSSHSPSRTFNTCHLACHPLHCRLVSWPPMAFHLSHHRPQLQPQQEPPVS